MQRVFVYGTLKRGFYYHETGLAGRTCLGLGRTQEAFPLIIGGPWYSPILLDEPGDGLRVLGEVYEVDEEDLANLDRLEGTHLPQGYTRKEITAALEPEGEAFQAWTYFKERRLVEVIHSENLEIYEHDPRYVPASERG